MHSVRIHQAIALIISFFYRVCVWHPGDKPTVKEIRLKIFYCYYNLLFVLSLAVGALTNEKKDQSVFLVELAVGAGVVLMKLWILIWKQDRILDLLSRVCVFSIRNDEDSNQFNDKIRGFVKFVVVFVIIVFVGGCLGTIILSVVRSEKTLFLGIGFPLDYRNSEIAFWIATMFIFSGVTLSITAIIFSIIIFYLLLICSLRYEHLGSELRNMGRASREGKIQVTEFQMQNNFFEDLTASIDSHLQIRELANEVESFFEVLFFIQFGTSSLCICGSTYCLAFNIGDCFLERLLHLITFAYFIADLFMITYFGNEISLSSNLLSYSIFESNWYDQPQSTKKCILIFGEYLKRPQEIVVGKLYPLTLGTFTRILNSAYKMFNILKSFQQ